MKLKEESDDAPGDAKMNRRRFLALGLASAAAGIIPLGKIEAAGKLLLPDRTLCFYNPFSKEYVESTYWRDGEYVQQGLDELNHIFRDIRTGKVRTINTQLLDLLFRLQQKIKFSEPFHIVSGYRTPRSNAILSRKKKGVAKNSLHIYGKAADIRLPGFSLVDLRKTASRLRGGGVGYYAKSKFLHIDIGRVRFWRG